MPSFLAFFPEHHRMVLLARQLRDVVRLYGVSDDEEFDEHQELGENPRAVGLIAAISTELQKLRGKSSEFSTEEKKEFDLISMCFVDITSFIGSGWIALLSNAVDIFMMVLETGKISI